MAQYLPYLTEGGMVIVCVGRIVEVGLGVNVGETGMGVTVIVGTRGVLAKVYKELVISVV